MAAERLSCREWLSQPEILYVLVGCIGMQVKRKRCTPASSLLWPGAKLTDGWRRLGFRNGQVSNIPRRLRRKGDRGRGGFERGEPT